MRVICPFFAPYEINTALSTRESVTLLLSKKIPASNQSNTFWTSPRTRTKQPWKTAFVENCVTVKTYVWRNNNRIYFNHKTPVHGPWRLNMLCVHALCMCVYFNAVLGKIKDREHLLSASFANSLNYDRNKPPLGGLFYPSKVGSNYF